MAADCNHDGVIDQLDVAMLNQAGTLLLSVDQSKPAEVLLETEEPPEADVESTLEQDEAEVNFFDMIMNILKSIFEMLIAYIPVPLK